MSENKNDLTELSENEPDIIIVQYDDSLSNNNDELLLEIKTEPQKATKEVEKENGDENGEEVDSPDLVNIEDYQTRQSSGTSSENGGEGDSAVLCETTLGSEISDVNYGSKVNQVYQPAEVDTNIISDIPNEVLVYTCQPINDDALNKYQCKTCDIVLGCIFCLKSHYESIHLNLGIIQYKCDQMTYLRNYTEICHKCNLVCESKEEMVEHRQIHFVTCDVCDMSFDSALFLSNHCKTTHEKFEVIISCDLCEQWFKQLQDLSDHYESFHEMILCIVCFKRFATIPDMLQHHGSHKIVLRHTESVLPYACSKCNQAFGEISELSSHLTKMHPKRKIGLDRESLNIESTKILKKTKRIKSKEIFHDCGGLSQEEHIIIVSEDSVRKVKKSKNKEK